MSDKAATTREWTNASTLLGDSLRRLGVSPRRVEEAVVLGKVATALTKLFPQTHQQIKPASCKNGVLKLVVEDNYLAQEIRLRSTELVAALSTYQVSKIALFRQ